MSSPSGLTRHQRVVARDRAVQAAMLGYRNRGSVHYTQDASLRWEGIRQNLVARHGQFPRHADCSAYTTWCLWNGLYVPFNVGDIINGQHWRYGWTGTQAQHGRVISHVRNARRGDLVLYGPGAPFKHVAIVVDVSKDVPVVVSHGSENGPYLLPYNYRSDVGEIRRYI